MYGLYGLGQAVGFRFQERNRFNSTDRHKEYPDLVFSLEQIKHQRGEEVEEVEEEEGASSAAKFAAPESHSGQTSKKTSTKQTPVASQKSQNTAKGIGTAGFYQQSSSNSKSPPTGRVGAAAATGNSKGSSPTLRNPTNTRGGARGGARGGR